MGSLTDTLGDVIERYLRDALRRHLSREHDQFVIGKVTAVDGTNFRLSAKLSGDTVATTAIPYLKTYSPTVNDYVIVVIGGGRNYLCLGNVNAVA